MNNCLPSKSTVIECCNEFEKMVSSQNFEGVKLHNWQKKDRQFHDLSILSHSYTSIRSASILNGRCYDISNILFDYLTYKLSIPFSFIRSGERADKFTFVHQFLSVKINDEASEIIIDPTLGQMIKYSGIFVGTRTELREVFLDKKRHLFKELVVEKKIQPSESYGRIVRDRSVIGCEKNKLRDLFLGGIENIDETREEFFDRIYSIKKMKMFMTVVD